MPVALRFPITLVLSIVCLAILMTHAQIAEAQRLAREWKSKAE